MCKNSISKILLAPKLIWFHAAKLKLGDASRVQTHVDHANSEILCTVSSLGTLPCLCSRRQAAPAHAPLTAPHVRGHP